MKTPIIVHEVIGSTQTEAIKALRLGKIGPCWIQALQQSQGIGRRGRKWESLKGNLMASWYGLLDIEVINAPQLAFVAALAVSDILRPHVQSADALKIKWPNDILYEGNKLCGILVQTESLIFTKKLGVVIGVGLNIKSSPELVAYTATNLWRSRNAKSLFSLDPIEWLPRLSDCFNKRLSQWMENGFESISHDWQEQAYGLNSKITAIDQGNTISGILKGLDERGALIICCDNGLSYSLTNAEVNYQDVPCYL